MKHLFAHPNHSLSEDSLFKLYHLAERTAFDPMRGAPCLVGPKAGDAVYVVGIQQCELAGSLYAKEILGLSDLVVPLSAKSKASRQANLKKISLLLEVGFPTSIHEIGIGGVLCAAVRLAKRNSLPLVINCTGYEEAIAPDPDDPMYSEVSTWIGIKAAWLFGEGSDRFLITMPSGVADGLPLFSKASEIWTELKWDIAFIGWLDRFDESDDLGYGPEDRLIVCDRYEGIEYSIPMSRFDLDASR